MLNRTAFITLAHHLRPGSAGRRLGARPAPAAPSSSRGSSPTTRARVAKATVDAETGRKPKAACSRSADGRLNQLTEDPTDSRTGVLADGRTIAFVRGGDVFSMRADGSGQRR